jgi:hypothetical protein
MENIALDNLGLFHIFITQKKKKKELDSCNQGTANNLRTVVGYNETNKTTWDKTTDSDF